MKLDNQFMAGMTQPYDNDCAGQVVAMAYVPWQNLDAVYEPEAGFEQGTIFPELDKPWMPGGAGCER